MTAPVFAHLPDIFVGVFEQASPVLWIGGAAPTTIRAIRIEAPSLEAADYGPSPGRVVSYHVRTVDAPTINAGHQIVDGATTYDVTLAEPDGYGMTVVTVAVSA